MAPAAFANQSTDSGASQSVDEVENLIQELTPAAEASAFKTLDIDPSFEVRGSSDDTSLAIFIDDENTELEISLPVEAKTRSTATANDGTVVLEGDSPVAIQQVANDQIRVHTITRSADGPHEFTYEFPGFHLRETPEGRIALGRGGKGEPFVQLATIEQPWAVDSNGTPIPTDYVVENGKLIQVLGEVPDDVEYPILADPTISFGWGIYVTYSKSEVKQIAPRLGWANFGTLICGALPWPYAGVCATLSSIQINSVTNTFETAAASNKCVEMHYIPGPGLPPAPLLIGWKSIAC